MKTIVNAIRYTRSLTARPLTAALLCAGTVWGQPPSTSSPPDAAGSVRREADYQVVDRGPDHRVWQQITSTTGLGDGVVLRTNSYTEMATGMHRQEGGKWVDAKPEIVLTPQGAEGHGARHQVLWAANLNTPDAIQLKTPEGRSMKSHVIGLAYHDLANGGNVLIAEVKDSAGLVLTNNQVVYADAFDGLKADVRYTYTRDGFEQDIILRERPPEPEVYGLDPETTDLLVLTEFTEAPEPVKKVAEKQVEPQADRARIQLKADKPRRETRPKTDDEELSFGAMRIGAGRAFGLKQEGGKAVGVNKQWTQVDGRNLLVERVTHQDIRKGLAELPEGSQAPRTRGKGSLNQVADKLVLPPVRVASTTKPMQMARAKIVVDEAPGYVLDYFQQLLNDSNVTLKSDTTYYVSGPVTLSGTTTIEGGTVVKYAKNVNARLNLATVVCKTDAYHQATFTAKDDNTIGETVSGSSGTPSGYYATVALSISTAPTLKYLRISRATTGISLSAGLYLNLWHSQILDCGTGVDCGYSWTSHYARNVLIHRVTTAFTLATEGYYTLRMENLTFRNVTTGVYASSLGPDHTSSTEFVNCLFSSVTVLGDTPSGGCGGCGGEECCCCCGGVAAMGIVTYNCYYPSDSAFVQVAAGASYLATSQYRNLGSSTLINANLLKDLKKKTTYPPTLVTAPITTPTTWGPTVALRDNDGQIDVGYHYDPLDYIVSDVTLTAALTLNDGVAVGIKGVSGGLIPDNGGSIFSTGKPTDMNRMASVLHVQEQATSVGGNTCILFNSGDDATRIFQFRFTDFAIGPGLCGDTGSAGSILATGTATPYFNKIVFQDCWLRGSIWGRIYTDTDVSVTFINNLVHRSIVRLWSLPVDNPLQKLVTVDFHNNLFVGGSLNLIYTLSTAPGADWFVRDNLFDQASQTLSTDTSHFIASHNGFISGTANSLGGTANHTGLTADYQAGALGSYYYPATGGASSLASLINVGSRTASAAALFHHTVKTSQLKEGFEEVPDVDIGYHYVALNTLGNPVDTDGDTVADYKEDANGNGAVEPGAGEAAWTVRKVVVNADYGWHQWGNAIATAQRATPGWEPWLGGNNGGHPEYNALNIANPYGDVFIQQVVDLGFAAVDHYSMAGSHEIAGNYALNHGASVFAYSWPSNSRGYFDYWFAIGQTFVGRGPTSVAIVAGGGLSASGSANQYGPQGEFIDAICYNSEVGGCGCSYWDTAQSWAHAAVAAKYATVRDAHPNWNPYDIRQYLRQVSTFYNQPWTDPITSRTFFGWRLDGGYGFPQVDQQCGGTPIGTPVPTGLPALALVQLPDLDAGPPLLPWIHVADDLSSITVNWKNWLQTGFHSTMIKMATDGVEANAVLVYETTDVNASTYTWSHIVTGSEVVFVYTKLNNGKISRTEVFTALATAPPLINTQPQSQTVPPNTTVTFTVAAVDQDPFPYQGNSLRYEWYRNGTLIYTSGPTLYVFNAQPAQAGNYTVKVINRATYTVSQVATLTVQ